MGGIGIAPGGNINYMTGHAVFEATHGTAPKYANLDKVNPGSVVLSGEMMLRYMGWTEAADLVIKGMDGAIARAHRHLRLRPPHGGGEGGEVQRVRGRGDRSTCSPRLGRAPLSARRPSGRRENLSVSDSGRAPSKSRLSPGLSWNGSRRTGSDSLGTRRTGVPREAWDDYLALSTNRPSRVSTRIFSPVSM